MTLLKKQKVVSPKRGMPTGDLGAPFSAVPQSGATIQLYYFNSGVLTADAGQVAGTVVVASLPHQYILDELGRTLGSHNDSSLSFTSTGLTTEKELEESFYGLDYNTLEARADGIAEGLSNGEYVVDYLRGVIYGKKADTSATLTSAAYSYSGAPRGVSGAFVFRDTSFVTGDSPVSHDVNAGLGRNAKSGYISNDGGGALTFAVDSGDGAGFTSEVRLEPGEVHEFENDDIDTLRVTWVADTSYRIHLK